MTLATPALLLSISALSLLAVFGLRVRRMRGQSPFKFRPLLESNMIGFLIVDANERIVEANDYFLNMLGYSRADLTDPGLSWSQITPPEYMDASLRAVKTLKSSGVTPPLEKEYLRKDGSRVPILIGSATIDRASGLRATLALDLSENRKADQALARANSELEQKVERRTRELSEVNRSLRESQAFLDSVIENIPNMIFVKDVEKLAFVRFNKAGEELLGYSRQDLIGKNDYDLFPKEQADFFTEKDRLVLSGKCVQDIPEEPLQTKEGTRILHTKKIPVFDACGKAQYLLGISEDITERKLAEVQRLKLLEEQAARKEAEGTARHFALLSDAMKALTSSLNYRQTMHTFTEVMVSSIADYCSIDVVEEEGDLRTIAILNRGPESAESIHQTWRAHVARVIANGLAELHEGHVMIVPLKVFDRVLGAITLASSLTQRAFTNLDLAVAQDLADRAAFAVENARLYERAQGANRAKSDFLANMSHEIRTPLGAVIGFAELMLDSESLETEHQGNVSTIIRNGRQLLKLVDEILDISKVESERTVIERVAFPLRQIIDDVTSLLRYQAQDKGLKLTVAFDSALPSSIVSDPNRLRQILINVIGNAVKFTATGTVEVRVDATAEQVRFTITDSGIGIRPEQEKLLFQPFGQADTSTSRKFGGTGLGLYLSKRFAQALGGDLVLQSSSPGVGSTFRITIKPESIVPFEQTSGKSTATDGPAMQKPLNVLVVDDAPDNRELIGKLLSRMGHKSSFAEDGRQCVSLALSQDYDLILMDIQMPEMDGFEAVSRLRQKNYQGPLVALTAHAMKGDREHCLAKGFDDYLVKPINREALFQTLAKYESQAFSSSLSLRSDE